MPIARETSRLLHKPSRKLPADYRQMAKQSGFHWLGPEVRNTMTKTGWQCSHGHCWAAPYNSIQSGKGCPACAGNQRKTPADYRALARARGFRWLGPEARDTKTRVDWQCSHGHRWQAPYDAIRRGKGCPVCAHRAAKTPADYRALARTRGLRWLGPEALKTETKTRWQCARGHQWEAPYHTLQQGHGCPVCAGTLPKTPDDYRALAKQRGFRWLRPVAPNIRTKTTWRCSLGHRWAATYNALQRGYGCPVCGGKMRKPPADYRALARQNGLRWLGPEVRNTRTKTGWQCSQGHEWQASYLSIRQGHGCPVCAHRRAARPPADYQRLAKQRGFRWLGPEVSTTMTKTGWQCAHGHRWETPYHILQEGKGCPICAGNRCKTPVDFRALAKQRGFRWLGPEVPNNHTKTTWMCSLEHQWSARYNTIQQGHGCPVCARPGLAEDVRPAQHPTTRTRVPGRSASRRPSNARRSRITSKRK